MSPVPRGAWPCDGGPGRDGAAPWGVTPVLGGPAASSPVIENFTTKREQVLDPRVAYVMTDMMQGVLNFGTAAGVRSDQIPEPVNKYPQFVAYLVQRLHALCPTLGKAKIAQTLARAGVHLATTTVGRASVIYRSPRCSPAIG